MHRASLLIVPALAALLLAVAAPRADADDADTVPAPVMAAYGQFWDENAAEIVDEIVARYRSEMDHVDPVTLEAFLDDMRSLLIAEISWDAMGRAETERLLLRDCGAELLESAAPVYDRTIEFNELPEDARNELISCTADVQLHSTSIPVYHLMAVAKERFPGLFRKHGIDPKQAD